MELRLLAWILIKPVDHRRHVVPGDIVVCGLLGTMSGLGENARLILKRFRESGFKAKASNFSRFAALEDMDGGASWPFDTSSGGAVVVCINPDILHLVFLALKRQRLINRRIIGMWYWELEVFPPQWKRALDCVDEVWVSSRFVAGSLRKITGEKPVHVVMPPLDLAVFSQPPRQDPLPFLKGCDVVFFMYDVRSVHARKNPEAVIEAFRRAAADRPNAALVIKVNNGSEWPETFVRLERAARGLTNVHIMRDKLAGQDMRDLLARADIVMSLHRAEGFGLLMAEAMASAKPVIATGWSGNLDFMTPECSVLVNYTLVPVEDPQHIYDRFGAVWAEPDIAQAAQALRRLLDDPAERHRLGDAARAHISSCLSKEKWLANIPASFWQALANE